MLPNAYDDDLCSKRREASKRCGEIRLYLMQNENSFLVELSSRPYGPESNREPRVMCNTSVHMIKQRAGVQTKHKTYICDVYLHNWMHLSALFSANLFVFMYQLFTFYPCHIINSVLLRQCAGFAFRLFSHALTRSHTHTHTQAHSCCYLCMRISLCVFERVLFLRLQMC